MSHEMSFLITLVGFLIAIIAVLCAAWLGYKAGWTQGHIEGLDYTRKHVGMLAAYKGETK